MSAAATSDHGDQFARLLEELYADEATTADALQFLVEVVIALYGVGMTDEMLGRAISTVMAS